MTSFSALEVAEIKVIVLVVVDVTSFSALDVVEIKSRCRRLRRLEPTPDDNIVVDVTSSSALEVAEKKIVVVVVLHDGVVDVVVVGIRRS